MKKALQLLLSILFIFSCSQGEESPMINEIEEIIEEINNPPTISNQEFSVQENAPADTSVGFVKASDPDGDAIQFISVSEAGFNIDRVTGELSVSNDESDLLDYETNELITLNIKIYDGKLETVGAITLNIEDIDDGPLTNFEKRVIDSFIWQTLYPTEDWPLSILELYKRTESIKIYFDGIISAGFRDMLISAIDDFNVLFSDGFEIIIVERLMDANVHLYYGSLADLNLLWPDTYEFVTTIGAGGVFVGLSNEPDRVWIGKQDMGLVKHEIGHAIGLGHSNQCTLDIANNSVMCTALEGDGYSFGPDFNDVDRSLIRYLYHPDMPSGLPGDEVVARLTEIILSER